MDRSSVFREHSNNTKLSVNVKFGLITHTVLFSLTGGRLSQIYSYNATREQYSAARLTAG